MKVGYGQHAQSTPLSAAGINECKRPRLGKAAMYAEARGAEQARVAAQAESNALARCDRLKQRRALLEDIDE